MLRLGCRRTLGVVLRRHTDVARYASNSAISSHHPNAPLELDPAFQVLLRDVEISLRNKLPPNTSGGRGPLELEVFPHDPDTTLDYLTSAELDAQDEGFGKEHRKSPAAAFGSQRIGAVALPLELQSSIERMVADSDKRVLHQDAIRLFQDETTREWFTSFDVKYKSGKEAGRHALTDATAFATVALPSHYSAIYAVLDHVKQRLGPDWQVQRVIDWGAATGSGLWASGHAFQPPGADERSPLEMEDTQLSRSTLRSYLGLDKREGLVRVGKRLIRDVEMGALHVSWQKSLHDEDVVNPQDGVGAMALSAFLLSSLPTTAERKLLVKEMWESGAEVIVLIDHKFENVAEAREHLLKLARRELEDPTSGESTLKGAHVVAPCPHDGACPLYHPGYGGVECSFSQRLQRPEFIRKTKHSGTGHENTEYSYIVIRRGPRPPAAVTKVGRIGDVGRREFAKHAEDSAPLVHLSLARDHHEVHVDEPAPTENIVPSDAHDASELSGAELSAALRHEAYSWPRLVFPPIKRSGHIILDGCTADGRIMRMTIPKSQGKQPFYDARKSGWGDLFPHEPKNPPQVREEPVYAKHKPTGGQDIGKRRQAKGKTNKASSSYAQLSEDIKEYRQEQRRRRRKEAMDYY